jgi:chromosome segregation ATPase
MANQSNSAKSSGSTKRQGFTAKPQATVSEPSASEPSNAEPSNAEDPIAILQATLATAQAKEATFQATIDNLEAQLNQQAETIQLLRTQLEQSQTLLTENKSLKATANPEPKTPDPKTPEPKTPEPKKSQTALATRRDRPVFKEGAPGGLTEKDIGWFD